MELYTERNNMRKAVKKTSVITMDMYSMLFDCCEKYYNNIAWKFPEECPDGYGCCGLDYKKFDINMRYDIPTLFRDLSERIAKPRDYCDYDQYALLDLIEFIGHNCRDISVGSFHEYLKHTHIKLLETNEILQKYSNDINEIFKKTGLLYVLTDEMIVERIIEDNVSIYDVEKNIESLEEPGLQELLSEAIMLFKQPNPSSRKDAVEKIWDALERLKTYYVDLDKKTSAEKIVKNMSDGIPAFEQLFNDEFKALTNIGNSYRIRHHETDKTDIKNILHYDYFFNRCLSLIAVAIQCLR